MRHRAILLALWSLFATLTECDAQASGVYHDAPLLDVPRTSGPRDETWATSGFASGLESSDANFQRQLILWNSEQTYLVGVTQASELAAIREAIADASGLILGAIMAVPCCLALGRFMG